MNLIGQKFGRLTVVSNADRKGYVVCKCDCGKTHIVRAGSLTKSRQPTRSCGCYRREVCSENGKRVIRSNSADRIAANAKYGTNIGVISSQKLRANNRSGHTGVWYDSAHGGYQAYISLHNKKHHLGSFKSLDEAAKARKDAEDRMFAPIIEARNAEIAAQ